MRGIFVDIIVVSTSYNIDDNEIVERDDCYFIDCFYINKFGYSLNTLNIFGIPFRENRKTQYFVPSPAKLYADKFVFRPNIESDLITNFLNEWVRTFVEFFYSHGNKQI